ncbi:hypothetical protein GGI43DRAFT_427466 [Trichoderma evansii]
MDPALEPFALFTRRLPDLIALIAPDIATYIRNESNNRFRAGVQQRVNLVDVFFGDDCFPTWLAMGWSQEEEDYHIWIQNRLLDINASSRVGDFIRNNLRDKCNEKLDEAIALGLALADIRMGEKLLPEWDQSAVEASIPVTAQPVEDHWEDSSERNILTFGADAVRAHTESTVSKESTTALSEQDSRSESSITSDSDSSSSDDVSSDDKNQGGEPVDDRYIMFTGGDPQPLPSRYSESDGEAPHILFGVEIVGGPNGTYEVDMEVYQAEDDSDVDELPEVELAVDATHYEFFFPVKDAVDANLPGMNLECKLELESPTPETDDFWCPAQWGDEDVDFDSADEEEEYEEDDAMIVDEDAMLDEGEKEPEEHVMMEF